MAIGPLVSPSERAARAFGWDPISALSKVPFKTLGVVGVGVVLGVLLLDLIGYLFAMVSGSRSSYQSVSRSLLRSAAGAWEERDSNILGEWVAPYTSRSGRSLDSVSRVLDGLARAVNKWEEQPAIDRVFH